MRNEPRATFSVEELDGVIVIIDHDEGRSVTNDAAVIVPELAHQFDLAGKRVIYRDTRGVWDEILVRGGRFAGFKSINETTLEAVLARLEL